MGYENFISYRRSETAVEVKNIYDSLLQRGYSTFCDIYSLGSGMFTDEIRSAIDNCTNFILVLNQHSLDRCTDSSDWLYKEISEALAKKKNIVCVFTSPNCDFPDTLPSAVNDIRFHNAIKFDLVYYEAFIDKLISRFLIGEKERSVSEDTRDFIIIDDVLVKYVGSAQIVQIPSNVHTIGKYAFKDQTHITKVLLNEKLHAIEEGAFERCSGINYILLPKSLKHIKSHAFSRCYNLAFVELNDGLEYIGEKCFSFCEKIKYIQIPQTVLSIHPTAFNNCSQLAEFQVHPENPSYSSLMGILYDKNVQKLVRCPENLYSDMLVLPETITTIKAWAFSKCTGIIGITFPNNVKVVEEFAFKDSCNIASLNLNDALEQFEISAIDGWQSEQKIVMGKRFHPVIRYNIEQRLNDIQRARGASEDNSFCLIKTAFESKEEARKMAAMLLDKKFIVSGQIKEMEGNYIWEDQLCIEKEYELTCFTTSDLYPEIEKFINEHHSYELCELICIPISNISPEFGKWIMNYIKC